MSVRPTLPPLREIAPGRFERTDILMAVSEAGRALAELKGVAVSIPNQRMLVDTLVLQEARHSSAIENIITTNDALFPDASAPEHAMTAAAKEVLRYRQALLTGFQRVKQSGLLTNRHILEVQRVLEQNRAGFRRVPGTTLKDQTGRVVFRPPDPSRIVPLMSDLERFLNDDPAWPADPLVRMAIAHHRFETIHPFYDGNGRTGRILNVLYLVKEQRLDIPVLYLSRHIVRTKARYYELPQTVRDDDRWEDWVLYLLDAVAVTAREGIQTVTAIRAALREVKQRIRSRHKFYSQDLINHLFAYPYTKVQFVEAALGVTRVTATKYLAALVEDGILERRRLGRAYYYMNVRLLAILAGTGEAGGRRVD